MKVSGHSFHTSLNTPYRFGREWVMFCWVAMVTTCLVLFCQLNFESLVFDKVAIRDGEYWRLVTCHFTHSSFSHGFWDVLAFAGSVVWLARYSVRAVLPAVLSGIMMVSVLLLSDVSPLRYYCGLSGIVFSPLIFAAYCHFTYQKSLISLAPILVIVGKLAADLTSQSTMIVNTDWPAYPESHAAGAIAGMVSVCVYEGFAALKAYRSGTNSLSGLFE